jgi:hypothetical protein
MDRCMICFSPAGTCQKKLPAFVPLVVRIGQRKVSGLEKEKIKRKQEKVQVSNIRVVHAECGS